LKPFPGIASEAEVLAAAVNTPAEFEEQTALWHPLEFTH
jgi:hypothetical protein